MRFTVMNGIFLACAVAALAKEAEDARPRRHLHQIKKMIVNKLFSSSEPNCTQSIEAPTPPPLETKFFRIPGFNNVVIKAVPKGSSESAPNSIDEELPPDSHIGIVGSYLGTNTLNETYNALLGVKNLLTSGILSAKHDMVQGLSLAHPPKVEMIAAAPSMPCASPLPLEPVRIFVKPPKVPVVPTQYSYKQVNQDGSVTTHSSSLDLNNGVRVTEDGKTLPFIINRVQKIPVHLPVPVLPEVSKIIVSKVVQPIPTFNYQQYLPGPVVVTETGNRIPSPPVFLMDRIEKVAAIASFPRAPVIDVAAKPVIVHAPVGHVINAPVVPGKPLPAPGPSGYSYSQMNVNGGMTTHTGAGVNGAVLVTENVLPTPLNGPLNGYPSLPENPFRHPASSGGYSYSQVHSGGKMTSYNGLGGQPGPVNVFEHRPLPPDHVSPIVPHPSNSFSYKQIGEGKMTTYTGSGMSEESMGARPAVVVHGVNHPVPPPHITDRIEKVAAGAKFNRPPYSTMPIVHPISVPDRYVFVPPVHTSVPQRPVKTPTTSGMSSFVYKQLHNDGSMSSYGAGGLNVEDGKTRLPPPVNMEKPFPQGNVRTFDSSMYSGPFPMDPVNPNAVKPSTPVSGSYSYKMVNSNMHGSHFPAGPVHEPIVDTFAAPPPFSSLPVPIEGCINPDIENPVVGDIGNTFVGEPPVLIERPVPISYSYKQISHSNSNPFLVVNVEDPVMDVKKVNMNLSQTNQAYQPLPPPSPPAGLFPAVSVAEHKPAFVQPAPFVPAPIATMPEPQVPTDISPSSSFSYKQVISQASPLPPPQPASDVIEHRPSTPAPPPMISTRVPQIQKDSAPPSSFSYKQVTSQGLFEYSDEFPTGVKTNLPPSALKPQGNPSGNVYVEQKPLFSSPIHMPIPASPVPFPVHPMPVPPSPMPVIVHPVSVPSSAPTFNSRNSLANNPIIVPEQSSFSFRSSNPDGSTITVKDDGHNSIAVHVEDSPKIEESQEAAASIQPVTNEPSVAEGSEKVTVTTSVPEGTPGPISGHAKPPHRRVLKRVRPAKHRGDIPDATE